MVTLRPAWAVVHWAASGQPAQRLAKWAPPVALIGTVWPAGQVTVRAARSTVKSAMVNPPGTAGLIGPRLDQRGVSGLGEGRECLAGGVGAVAQDLDLLGLVGEQVDPDGGVSAARAGGLAELAGGDQPGLGLSLSSSLCMTR